MNTMNSINHVISDVKSTMNSPQKPPLGQKESVNVKLKEGSHLDSSVSPAPK